jgi:hypothetical protein
MRAIEGAIGPDAVVIGANHRKTGLAALFLIVGFGIALKGALAARNPDPWLLLVLAGLFGPFIFMFARRAVTRRPALVIDSDGLTDCQTGVRLAWGEIADLYAREYQGFLGLDHQLVVTATSPALLQERWHTPRRFGLRRPKDGLLEIQLDLLSPGWEAIADIVESKSGRSLPRQRQGRVRRKRSRHA